MVKEVAQAMIDQGLQAAGYSYVNLDDCWEATTRDPKTGAMRADPERFTGGSLKPLADWLHARKFSFGMYTSAGEETCSTGGRTVPGKPDARGVPGSIGHYVQDASTYAEWGVDYVKMDWCSKLDNNGTLTHAMAAALNLTGRPMWLNFHCGEYTGDYKTWCARDGNSFRIGPDHHDVWSRTAEVIELLATVSSRGGGTIGPYAWADADFLMTGGAGCDTNEMAQRCPGQSEDEYRTEFSLWSVAASQIIVATVDQT